MAKRIQEINAGSMADIAFLLLIFYLVSTTMNVDSGLQRMLPPYIDPSEQQQTNKVNKRNTLLVFVDAHDRLMVQSQIAQVEDLNGIVKEFILNPQDREDMPEKVMEKIDLIGEYPVGKGLVSLQNDRATSYDMYMRVQNELVRAFNELRDDLAADKFGRKFDELSDDEKKAIQTAIPLRISEAEPRDMTGGKK
ncbi:MAG: biopolymer transporter ExbD [Rikenellaceae bacterium]|nr:biopolymer transporter ExbD [Rikenellaceae bacterium]